MTPAELRPETPALADLAVGETAIVTAIDLGTGIGRRLGDLGFLPGTRVLVRGRAPLGDPTVYELRGSQFCLRRSEAGRIQVRRSPEAAGD